MKKYQQFFTAFLTTCFLIFAPSSTLSKEFTLTEGVDYELLPESVHQKLTALSKIEIKEFFSYYCPHCASFEPHIQKWKKEIASNTSVEFQAIPVVFRPQWKPAAELFFALHSLKKQDSLHPAVFSAIHSERVNFSNQKKITEWVVSQGIQEKDYEDAVNSFFVKSQVSKANQEQSLYRIDGVPSIIVAGKYKLPGNKFKGNWDDVIKNINLLIIHIQKEERSK